MSRQYKTGKNNRETYTYFDCFGRKHVVRPGENGVTEDLIAILHEMDDKEHDMNRREDRRVPYRLSIGDDDNYDVTMKRWLKDESSNPEVVFDDAESEAELEGLIVRLFQARGILLKEQQELLIMVFEDERSNVDIAREGDVTETAIRGRLSRIYSRLKDLLTLGP